MVVQSQGEIVETSVKYVSRSGKDGKIQKRFLWNDLRKTEQRSSKDLEETAESPQRKTNQKIL
jgi:hypothetical protein